MSMIVLHTFGPALGQPDPSAFVMKTMIHLRMAGLDYEVRQGMASLRRAPRQKLPFIEDGARVIADSTLIREYLEETYNIDFDAGYGARERAVGYAVQKMFEESTYFAAVHRRWIRPDGWAVVRKELLGVIPPAIRWLVALRIQKQVRRQLHAQGTGRMTEAEIDMIAERSAKAVSEILGGNPYLLGERPSAADATVLAFLLAGSSKLFPGPIRDSIVGRSNLLAYRDRLKAQYFPDFRFED
jgi:glutathione S-transferase